jgi:hypothetical protein
MKLIIRVTPYDLDSGNIKKYREQTKLIRDTIKGYMINYLTGTMIRLQGRIPTQIQHSTGNLAGMVGTSSVRRDGDSFVTSVYVASDYATYLEFGTGMYGELASPHKIYPKGGKKAFKSTKIQVGRDVFFSSIMGQYPKPFLRVAVMRMAQNKALIENVIVNTRIFYPAKAHYKRTFKGKVETNEEE